MLQFNTIHTFDDFCPALRQAGFSLSGPADKGIFTLSRYFGPEVQWHTGDRQTDPWEWRMRSVEECRDMAYGNLFFRRTGWVTLDWYPYFVAVRREGKPLEQLYQEGHISQMAYGIYSLIREYGEVSVHKMQVALHVTKETRSAFQAALVHLQMQLLITVCGSEYKMGKNGQPYGWPTTVFCSVERFFGGIGVAGQAQEIGKERAAEKIAQQVRLLNPQVEDRALQSFIFG